MRSFKLSAFAAITGMAAAGCGKDNISDGYNGLQPAVPGIKNIAVPPCTRAAPDDLQGGGAGAAGGF
ncbi:MAG: hypothetical protein LBK65_04135 [Tannerellaceae bacterium]|nr:hypothetical protein [Tannerellaceae bacterium]